MASFPASALLYEENAAVLGYIDRPAVGKIGCEVCASASLHWRRAEDGGVVLFSHCSASGNALYANCLFPRAQFT